LPAEKRREQPGVRRSEGAALADIVRRARERQRGAIGGGTARLRRVLVDGHLGG
jgi:hypothetical protein